jgi:aminoacylase
MNVEFGLDEGLASPTDTFSVYYGERMPWWIIVSIEGAVGHGSSFTENTASEKLSRFIAKVNEFRDSQIREKKLRKIKRGEVVTINLTGFQGGDLRAINVIPSKIKIGVDVRMPPQVHVKEMLKLFNSWTNETGVSYEFMYGTSADGENPVTSFDNKVNKNFFNTTKWWKLMEHFFEENELKMDATIFPASTDSRIYRLGGVTMIGFSPMIHTPVLLHDHNEFLHKDIFIRGVHLYVKLIKKLFSN